MAGESEQIEQEDPLIRFLFMDQYLRRGFTYALHDCLRKLCVIAVIVNLLLCLVPLAWIFVPEATFQWSAVLGHGVILGLSLLLGVATWGARHLRDQVKLRWTRQHAFPEHRRW